jgi:hypothetical protein
LTDIKFDTDNNGDILLKDYESHLWLFGISNNGLDLWIGLTREYYDVDSTSRLIIDGIDEI